MGWTWAPGSTATLTSARAGRAAREKARAAAKARTGRRMIYLLAWSKAGVNQELAKSSADPGAAQISATALHPTVKINVAGCITNLLVPSSRYNGSIRRVTALTQHHDRTPDRHP